MTTSIFNKKSLILLQSVIIASLSMPVVAENWSIRDGTEQKNDSKMYFSGLIQPTFQSDSSSAVNGLQGPLAEFNGKNTTLTNIGPSYDSTQGFYLFRVRFGVRGTAMKDVNYEFVGEYGSNALTTQPGDNPNVELADGSITFNQIPGMRVRAGIFKTPGPEESLRYAIEYINFTNATQFLVNTQPYRKVADNGQDVYVAVPRSGVRAFRDTGVQLFDAFTRGNHELSYAVMAGNGNTLNKSDDNDELSYYGRIQYSYLFPEGDSHPFQRLRPDLTVFAWHHDDNLTFDGEDYELNKTGVGLTYTRNNLQFNAEYMEAEGMQYLSPLFKGQAGGQLFASTDNEATGWYLDVGRFVTKNWLLGLRYDVLEQDPVDKSLERSLKTTTLAAQYYFTKKVRLAFNYEIRDYDLGNQSLMSAVDAANMTKIEDSVDDRIALQLTVKF